MNQLCYNFFVVVVVPVKFSSFVSRLAPTVRPLKDSSVQVLVLNKKANFQA